MNNKTRINVECVEGKYIFIRKEDILNLKCARKRIMKTLTSNYDAIEIFTIDALIKQYESNN